ncbi:hypothetical protein Y1Q_0022101 [Alligator mississippiensis]|uniref:Uncharacterized protein n=1 Tax=Alligator mississippiensis TaxID=8496 RepID=A0A151M4N6_ALLMI|nr:hypothetical protein Y1Q_0022101 [Alligator mississippiensis]
MACLVLLHLSDVPREVHLKEKFQPSSQDFLSLNNGNMKSAFLMPRSPGDMVQMMPENKRRTAEPTH